MKYMLLIMLVLILKEKYASRLLRQNIHSVL